MVPPVTQDAQLIKDLYDLIFIIAVVIFVFVEGLLIYTAIRFRRRKPDEMPAQVHGSRALELLWTVIPAIIVAVIFFLALDTMNKMTASGTLSNPVSHVHAINDASARRRVEAAQPVDLVIDVTARQWVWQFKYPGEAGVIANETLVVPAGKNIRLDMTSADVIHAWWVPYFGAMIYVNPGELSYVWFNVPEAKAGEYQGQCNVYCGVSHANMLAKVRVLPQAEYDKWYAEQAAANSGTVQAGDPQRGHDFFMTGPCTACHSIEGTPAQGKVAPRALTHFASYPNIAQVEGFANNADNVKKWLKDPLAHKPGTAMPNLNLTAQQIEDLAAYLESLK